MIAIRETTNSQAGTSSRKYVRKVDLVKRAEKKIGQYRMLMDQIASDSEPVLHGALAATYAAVLDLQKSPDLLQLFLDDRRSGPISKNPIKPIVRKLWRRVPTRDTLHRYSSCLALAHREKVKPAEFVAWVKATTIKQAAAKWSKIERNPDEQVRVAATKLAKRDQLLAAMTAVPLSCPIGSGLQPGLYAAVIRVSPEVKVELFVFDQMDPPRVDALVLRNAR